MNNNEFFNFDSPMVNGDANANQHNPNTLIDVGQRTNALEGDAIRRQAVLETLDDMDNVLDEDRTIENYKELLKECYEVLPPVNLQPSEHFIDGVHAMGYREGYKDAQKQKSGKWEVVSDGYGDSAYICECSECKDTVWVYKNADRKWNYCPNCGCRMVKPQESEDT